MSARRVRRWMRAHPLAGEILLGMLSSYLMQLLTRPPRRRR